MTRKGPRGSWWSVRSPGTGCWSLGCVHCWQLPCLLGSLRSHLWSLRSGPSWASEQREPHAHWGLLGLPRQGARGYGRPPSEGRVVQLGVGHVLEGFRCDSLRGGRCVRWGTWGPGEEGPICCVSVHPSRNPPNREDGEGGAWAPPAFVISGAHRAPVPSWRPVTLEGDSEAGQAPPGSAALLQPAPRCAKRRFGTSGQVSSLS